MDQDATWYEGRPRAGQHCVKCGPISTHLKGTAPPQFSVHVCCGQTAGWIKMSLGRKVGFGPGHIVLHGHPPPLPKKGTAPNFRPMSIVAKRLDGSRWQLAWRWALVQSTLCWGPPLPRKGGAPIFGPFLLWPKGWMHQNGTWYGGRPQPRRLCVRWRLSPPLPKGAEPPIFGPCLLRPNVSMHQDATWYGGRPQPRRLCVRWRPSPLSQGGDEAPSQFLAHVYCGQTAGWIKMAVGVEVGLGPIHMCWGPNSPP